MKIHNGLVVVALLILFIGCNTESTDVEVSDKLVDEYWDYGPVEVFKDDKTLIYFSEESIGYKTTSGGYFEIEKRYVLNLPSEEEFLAISSDSSSIYILLLKDGFREIHKISEVDGALIKVCSIFNQGFVGKGFASDNDRFYFSSDDKIRVFDTSCVEQDDISIDINFDEYRDISVRDDIIYLVTLNNKTNNYDLFSSFSIHDEFELKSLETITAYGSPFYWGCCSLSTVTENYIWGANWNGIALFLWRIDIDGTQAEWVELPVNYIRSVATLNSDSTVVIASLYDSDDENKLILTYLSVDTF